MTKFGEKIRVMDHFASFSVSYVLFPSQTEHMPGLHLCYLTVNIGIFYVWKDPWNAKVNSFPWNIQKAISKFRTWAWPWTCLIHLMCLDCSLVGMFCFETDKYSCHSLPHVPTSISISWKLSERGKKGIWYSPL